jgi:hypothetical protein
MDDLLAEHGSRTSAVRKWMPPPPQTRASMILEGF